MKFVIAIIKPHKLDAVKEAIGELGISGMTVSEVKGFGRQRGHTEIYRGAEYQVDFVPKLRLEIACSDDLHARLVEAVQQAAKTDQIGDGKIFSLELGGATRIRTGEDGDSAL